LEQLPGAGPHVQKSVERLAREIVDAKLNVAANCAARTHENDIRPIAEISQRVGIPIEACTFIGSSPIRQFAEEWELDWIIEQSAKAVRFAVGEGLPVTVLPTVVDPDRYLVKRHAPTDTPRPPTAEKPAPPLVNPAGQH